MLDGDPVVKKLNAEIERLRTIIRDANDEMIAEKGEYHTKSGLGQTMAAVLQQRSDTEKSDG